LTNQFHQSVHQVKVDKISVLLFIRRVVRRVVRHVVRPSVKYIDKSLILA
jgi:hypothetical protein